MRFTWLLLMTLLVNACAPTPTSTPTPTPRPVPSIAPSATALPTQQPTPTKVIVNTPLPPPPNSPTPPSRSISLELEPVVSGLANPTNLVNAHDDSDRLFVTAKPGRIQIILNDQVITPPFLDISDRVLSSSYERGLLGLAFSPAYTTDGFFYVNYTRQPDGATIIARYSVSNDKPNAADPNSEVILLKIDQPEPNHNGGQIAFGPDGYLYIGMGDGGGGGDPHGEIGNGQDLKSLLGKILRIDVQADRYAIPPTNPFGDEIWAYGLRNPWRFSFDRLTGDLYIGDVGQNAYEEINFQPAASPGGENYGWRIMEGRHCYNPRAGCNQTGLMLPIAEYSHDLGCSVTGGTVYRGQKYPQLNGLYFFADFCSGLIWTLQRDAQGKWQMLKRLEAGFEVSSFGADQSGEVYVLNFDDGTVYRLVAR